MAEYVGGKRLAHAELNGRAANSRPRYYGIYCIRIPWRYWNWYVL